MNKCIFSIALVLLSGAGYGQQVSCSGNASFMLSASFHGKADGNWIQKVTSVKVMILDKKKTADVQQWDQLLREAKDQRYEDLVSVRKGQDRVRLMVRDGDGVKELAFLAGDKDGGLYIQFAGKFTEHDLEQMQSSLRE
ncbi:MAG TPA: DUF4252 domain-containing protein [Puia sp.]|jgi:hypothetical protein